MVVDLEPCPFCGAYGAFVRTECPTMWVECRFCGAQGPFAHGETNAAEAWNARADAEHRGGGSGRAQRQGR